MVDLNETHDPALESRVESANAPTTDSPIQNLPFEIFRRHGSPEAFRGGVAIGVDAQGGQGADAGQPRPLRGKLLDAVPDAGAPQQQRLLPADGRPLRQRGTISGPTDGERGCLLEFTERGTRPFDLPGGESRTFLEDDDEVIFRGRCERDGFTGIGFGECRGLVLPAA